MKKAWCHVDLDGLEALRQGRGLACPGDGERFYLGAVDNSLSFFEDQGLKATYFAVARDLERPARRAALRRIVGAGHEIACHGFDHVRLEGLEAERLHRETALAREAVRQALGVPCLGFRATAGSLDFPAVEALVRAGFLYDASLLPDLATRHRTGMERIHPEPFLVLPDPPFFEIPLPWILPYLPAFPARGSSWLARLYTRACLDGFRRANGYLTLRFRLADFADPQPLLSDLRLDRLAGNLSSRAGRLRSLRGLVRFTRRHFTFTTTEAFLADWPLSAPDLVPSTVLGVSTSHETGACIVRDGELVAAVNEERLSRVKLDSTYPPRRSVREVIRIAGIDPGEIQAVAIAGLRWPNLLEQTLASFLEDVREFHSLSDHVLHLCRLPFRLFYFARATRYGSVLRFLRREYGIAPKVFHVEHHQAHAASAYRFGGVDPALVVTADGDGDDVTLTIGRAKGGLVRRLHFQYYPHSFGQFYSAGTQVLGFRGGRHEGKVTGLSGFGRPDPILIQALEGTLRPRPGRFGLDKRYYVEGFPRGVSIRKLLAHGANLDTVDARQYKPALKRLVAGYPREDVAFAFQALLEKHLAETLRFHAPGDGEHLALAGGVFANVKLNASLLTSSGAGSVFVFPAMGDGGLCAGAAADVCARPPRTLAHVFLGTAFDEDALRQALDGHPGLEWDRPGDLADTVAGLLADRYLVARFDGPMEFGPRALGNRSILCHCGDATINEWLNRRLVRTEFMPFAPVCLSEDAALYFDVPAGAYRAAGFMTIVVPCTERMKRECPAAVHVDGTARPQLLRLEVNPGMHALLLAYKRRTGVSCLINTSFNMHEEPIVRAPGEAIAAFLTSGLDFLALGPFLVRRPGGVPADGRDRHRGSPGA